MKKMILFLSMILFLTLVFTPSTYSMDTGQGDEICFVDNVNLEMNFNDPLTVAVDYCYIGNEVQSAIVNCFTFSIIETTANLKLPYEINEECLAIYIVNLKEEIEVIGVGYNNSNILLYSTKT